MNEENEKKWKEEQRKEIATKIGIIIGYAIVIVIILSALIPSVHTFVYRLQHPKLTNTELLIWSFSKYWYCYIILVVSSIWSGLRK